MSRSETRTERIFHYVRGCEQYSVAKWEGRTVIASLAGLGWLLLGYGFYRLSLSFHRRNGEVFKSLFDLYRSKLRDMTSLAPYEPQLWRATWAYLQYLRIPRPKCHTGTVSVITKDCSSPQCGTHVPEAVEEFYRTGKLVAVANGSRMSRESSGVLDELLEVLRRKATLHSLQIDYLGNSSLEILDSRLRF